MGSCYLCNNEAYFYSKYLRQDLCKKHFEKMLIRRIRGDTATLGFSGNKYNLINDGSIGYKLNKFIFAKADKGDVVIDNLLLDDFAISVFKYFVTKGKISVKVKDKNYFNPLYLISREEAIAFLKLKNIKYTVPNKEDDLVRILKKLEDKRPGAMISIVKSGIRVGLI